MPKKLSPRKAEQHELDEFAEKYEILSSIYKDPVEVLFEIMTHPEASMELRAGVAVDLMAFRFPKLKALENKNPEQGKSVTINMTFTAPEPKKELDITPPTLQLVTAE